MYVEPTLFAFLKSTRNKLYIFYPEAGIGLMRRGFSTNFRAIGFGSRGSRSNRLLFDEKEEEERGNDFDNDEDAQGQIIRLFLLKGWKDNPDYTLAQQTERADDRHCKNLEKNEFEAMMELAFLRRVSLMDNIVLKSL